MNLMQLVASLVLPAVQWAADQIPSPPTVDTIVLPWPNWLPATPFLVALGVICLAGGLALGVRFAMWIMQLVRG